MSKRRLCLPWVCFLSTENKTQQTHGRPPADPRGQIARVPWEAPAPAPGRAPGRLPWGPRDLGGPGWGAPSARVTDSGSRSSTGPGPPGAKVHTGPWAYGASSLAPSLGKPGLGGGAAQPQAARRGRGGGPWAHGHGSGPRLCTALGGCCQTGTPRRESSPPTVVGLCPLSAHLPGCMDTHLPLQADSGPPRPPHLP